MTDADHELYDLVSEYVAYGALREGDAAFAHFEDTFRQIAKLAKNAPKKAPGDVYRVIALGPDDARTLASDGIVHLRPRPYGSWTTSKAAVPALLRSRALTLKDDHVAALVVKRISDPDRVLLDVPSLYRRLGYDHPDVHEWGLYVEWESEVILHQDDEMLRIGPSDLVSLHRKGDTSALAPAEGDTAWNLDDENFFRIREVIGEGTEPNAWRVVSDDGIEQDVVWNIRHASWDGARAPSPSP